MLPLLVGAKRPTLALGCAAVLCAIGEVWADGGWSPSGIAACITAALAILEWVNYYGVQLQHFDHFADLRRLVTGKGFREAHLAKTIRRWQATKVD